MSSCTVVQGDSSEVLSDMAGPVHLVLTSPPYHNLKRYPDSDGQLGNVDDYDAFLSRIGSIWRDCFRMIVPGGRLVCVVGDVCLSRRAHGRHRVIPLHSHITVACEEIGFDVLTPILWEKITNAAHEAGGSGFFGQPYQPNAIVKNEVEYVLMFRKPGGYRMPSREQRELSRIPEDLFKLWLRQVWRIGGASTANHPAPYPLELASRLVRMFSFHGDTVLDPFVGTGTTLVAASNHGRVGVGIDVDPDYCDMAWRAIGGSLPRPGASATHRTEE